MKVLLVLDSYPPDLNGGAYFTHRLAKALLEKNILVKVACPSLSIKSCLDVYEGVPLFRLSSFNALLYKKFRIINPILLNHRVTKLLKIFNPDVIHLQGKFLLGNATFKVAKKLKFPCMATNHLMPENFEHHFKIPSLLHKKYVKFVWNWVFKMFDQLPIIVSPTQSGADEMYKNGFKKTVRVISCGVDNYLFTKLKNTIQLKQHFQLPDLPVLLYTGRLDYEKNIDIVLTGCSIALKKVDFQFVITGTGKEELRLKKLALKLGISHRITFTGKINDKEFPSIYSVADVFVNACNIELQCISGLEALASGLPLVLSESMALPELINAQTPNGFTFPPQDYETLAKLLIYLFRDQGLRIAMGHISLEESKKHDLGNTADSYIKCYEELIL